MENTNSNPERISEEALHAFYAHAVLPQFGLHRHDIAWQPAQELDGDESLHRFSTDERSFALIFEDHQGLGNNEAFIKNTALDDGASFRFIAPISETSISPSYDGFRLPAPSQHCHNATGTFTLIEVL
jgi:hypothetical protein